MLRRLLTAVALTLGLSACADNTPPPSFPAFSYDKASPLRLDIATIETVGPRMTGGAGHIENRFDVPPASAVKAWIQGRLVATGASGKAVVTIDEASAVESQAPLTSSMLGIVKEGGEWRIDARITARIEANRADANSGKTGNASVEVRRSRTLPRDVTAIERRQAYYEITRDLMAGFDKDFTAAIRAHLGDFLR